MVPPLCAFSSPVFLGSWIPDFYYHRIRNSNYPFLGIGPRFRPFEVDAATIVPSFLGWFCARVLPLFLTVIFMVLFRSAIAPEIACFIGFFWELAPFFEDS